GPDDTVGAAAEIMARRKIRRVPVVDGGLVVGIVAKSDVLNACPPDFNPFSAEALGAEALTAPLRQIMSPHPITVRPDAPVEVAAQLMRSEEHTSELQSRGHLVCRLLLEKKNSYTIAIHQ